jgi:antitoxin PrlF
LLDLGAAALGVHGAADDGHHLSEQRLRFVGRAGVHDHARPFSARQRRTSDLPGKQRAYWLSGRLRFERKDLPLPKGNASITHYLLFETRPMATSTSKLTTKYQATIPAPVRKILHIEAGDAIAFDIQGEEVRVRKARPLDHEFARALEGTLVEWSSAADEDAYRDL